MPVRSVPARQVLIFGAGAVGGYLGAMLSAFGHEVILVGRPHVVKAIQRRGLTLLRPEGLEAHHSAPRDRRSGCNRFRD